jgi:photosystem II stability/assembly factor-like uncharacterized protein
MMFNNVCVSRLMLIIFSYVALVSTANGETVLALSQKNCVGSQVWRGSMAQVKTIANMLFAVGSSGQVGWSSDGGKSWCIGRIDKNKSVFTDFVSLDEKRTWIVGHDASIHATGDGGVTWSRQYEAGTKDVDTPLFSTSFADGAVGIAVGAFGLVLRTNDSGKSWTEDRSLPTQVRDRHLNSVVAVSTDRFLVVGEAGTVLTVDRSGSNWAILPFPYRGSLWGVRVLSSGEWLVFGMAGNIYISRDKGLNWQKLDIGASDSISAVVESEKGDIAIVGTGGLVRVGRVNQSFKTVAAPRATYAAVAWTSANDLVLGHPAGMVILSSSVISKKVN